MTTEIVTARNPVGSPGEEPARAGTEKGPARRGLHAVVVGQNVPQAKSATKRVVMVHVEMAHVGMAHVGMAHVGMARVETVRQSVAQSECRDQRKKSSLLPAGLVAEKRLLRVKGNRFLSGVEFRGRPAARWFTTGEITKTKPVGCLQRILLPFAVSRPATSTIDVAVVR